MTASPTRSFTIVLAVITLLEIIGEILPNRILLYGCKPLIMALLILYAWQYCRAVGFVRYLRWLLIGMVFALLGDSLLMIREVDLFAPGLGAFLIMQICYGIAFWQSTRQQNHPVMATRRWLIGLIFGVYAGVFLVLLRPAFTSIPARQLLWWPVVIYVVFLNLMGLLATTRRGLPGYSGVVTGAVLFILSDSVIAVNKFLFPVPGAAWLIMSTYAAAQYLIVVGMITQLVADKPVKPVGTLS